MKFLEFVKRAGALALCLLMLLPVVPVAGTGDLNDPANRTADNPGILVSWHDEAGNYVEEAAQNLGVDPATGQHQYFLQITDPYVLQNLLGALYVRVTNQEEDAIFVPDLSNPLNFLDLYQLDVPVPILKNQPDPMREWYLTLSANPLPLDPAGEPDVEPYVEPEDEPYVEPEDEPYVEPEDEPYVEPEDEPYVEPEDEPYVEPEDEPYVEPEDEPYVEPEGDPYVEPEGEPAIDDGVVDGEGYDEGFVDDDGGIEDPAAEQPPALDTSVASEGVTKGELNIRSEPTKDNGGNVVTVVPANTMLDVVGQLQGTTNPNENWYSITLDGEEYPQFQNMELYAYDEWVRLLTAEEAEAILNPPATEIDSDTEAEPDMPDDNPPPVVPSDTGSNEPATKYAGYGLIKAESAPVPLYAEKPAGAGQDAEIMQLVADTLVYVWDQEVLLTDGTLWSKVVVQFTDGVGGWVTDSAITQITASQAQQLIDARKTPSPPPPTETPEPEPTPTVRPLEGPIHHYGIVNSPGIKLRVVPVTGTIKESMSKGTMLYVRKAVYNEDQTWYQVDMLSSNGKVANYGYVLSEYVTMMTQEEEDAYVPTLKNPPTPYPDESQEATQTPAPAKATATPVPAKATATPAPAKATATPVPAKPTATPKPGTTAQPTAVPQQPTEAPQPTEVQPTAAPEPTKTPKPTATPQPYNNYAITVVNNAPMRGNPSSSASLINVLPINEVVFVLQQAYDSNGMMWHLIYYGGEYGYMRADMLRYMTYSEIQNYLGAHTAPTSTPAPQITVPPISTESDSGYAELAKGGVNFRKSPSNTATVMRRLDKGTLVMVLGTATGDNYTWYQVEQNGTTGYIRGDMLNILTISQLNQRLQDLQGGSSGSSSSGGSGGNTNVTIPSSNSGLADLQNVDSGWTNNISALPSIVPLSASPSVSPSLEPTATPDPFGLATDETSLFPSAAPVTAQTDASGPPFLLLGAGVVLLAGGATAYGLVLRNKNLKQQEAAARRRTTAQQQQAGAGQRRATTQPVNRTGQAGVTSTIAGAAAKGRDGQTNGARRMPPSADGTRRTENDPVAQQRRAQQGGQSPYARPASQGSQAGASQPQNGQNPYARPSSQAGQAGRTGAARTGQPGSAPQQRGTTPGSTQQRPAPQQPRQGGATTPPSANGTQQRPRTDRRGTEKPPEDRT